MIDSGQLVTLFMAATVAFAIGMYIMLDGFDLGIGILFGFAKDSGERDQMMNSIAPFWDGNETWLVFGAAVLLAMFPLAFSILLPAFYLPVIVMLLALIFRGVAFEFRFRHDPRIRIWDLCFTIGSILATFAQGLVLGTFLQGVRVVDGHYAGGDWEWLSPFAIVTGLALVVGYSLLGATWLFWRVAGDLQRRAGVWAARCLFGLLAAIVVISIWTPFQLPYVAARWFDFPASFAFAPVPILTGLCAMGTLYTLRFRRSNGWPLGLSLGLFFLSYTGLAISIFPLLPPPTISLFDAASSAKAQWFLLPGVVVLVPLILIRTWQNFNVFRSHGDEDVGYGLE